MGQWDITAKGNNEKNVMLLCLLFTVSLAHAFNESDIVGKWNVVRVVFYNNNVKEGADEVNGWTFTLNRDHSASLRNNGDNIIGAWRLNASKLLIYPDDNDANNIQYTVKSVEGKKMILNFGYPGKNERAELTLYKIQ